MSHEWPAVTRQSNSSGIDGLSLRVIDIAAVGLRAGGREALDVSTRKRVESADAERLLEWGERFVEAKVLQDVFADN